MDFLPTKNYANNKKQKTKKESFCNNSNNNALCHMSVEQRKYKRPEKTHENEMCKNNLSVD